MKILLILKLVLISLNLWANGEIAEVIVAKGELSVLHPQTLSAVTLKKGMKLKEDSSILSGKKSFARLKFNDGSIVNLGPDSKMVLKVHRPNGKTLLSLLKGKVRATVNKSKKDDPNKFFIKTKSAAVGVRGTDFQTTYDPESARTSLLTYEGTVAIKKVDPDFEKRVSKFDSDEDKVEFVKKTLEKEDQLAEIGDFTNVDPVNQKAQDVVKINPQQLVLLEKDETLGVEKVPLNKEKFTKEVKRKAKLIRENARKRGIEIDDENLGLVDTQTGLYIPQKEGKTIGRVSSNGQYVAPKGLKLDSVKGFVPVNESDKDEAEELNKELLKNQVSDEPENPAYKRYFRAQ